MIGYKYNTELEGNMAIAYINQTLGIPKNEDSVTRTYCELQEGDGFWHILQDEVIENILGEGVEI